MHYLIVFIGVTVANVLLLALYAIMVFNEHKPCTTKSGKNITTAFELLFRVGFTLQIIDSCNMVLALYLRVSAYVNQKDWNNRVPMWSRVGNLLVFGV